MQLAATHYLRNECVYDNWWHTRAGLEGLTTVLQGESLLQTPSQNHVCPMTAANIMMNMLMNSDLRNECAYLNLD